MTLAKHKLPVIVIAGRPNVGKSTLFNRLAGRRFAIVSDQPGVTRDRKSVDILLNDRPVTLIDTAGWEEDDPETVHGRMRISSERAVDMADVILFCVDARMGITPVDEHFAQWLRKQGRKILLVVNKAEGHSGNVAALEMYKFGLGEPIPVSAEHGEGIMDRSTREFILSHIAPGLPAFTKAISSSINSFKVLRMVRGENAIFSILSGRAYPVT